MNRPRVAVTLEQCWHSVPGGTATSALRAVEALDRADRLDLVGVSARHRHDPDPPFRPGVEVRQMALPRPVLYESWHRFRRPTLRRVVPDADVAWVTGVAMPPSDLPLAVTVHDLAFRHHPEHHTRQGRRFFRRALELARDEASVVVCPSDATRRDCEDFGIEAERLRVVPWGVRPSSVTAADVARVRAAHGLEGPYVLWVGTVEPRKNLSGLVDAMALLGREDVTLALAGPIGWNEDLDGLLADRSVRTRALGFVDDADLGPLYAGAAVFCYPSLMEGFGLPVLEAMVQGAPVVTSSGTATEELLGAGGVAVDPLDPTAIAAALAAYLDDEDRAAAAGAAGRRQAAIYSWDATAERLADVLVELSA